MAFPFLTSKMDYRDRETTGGTVPNLDIAECINETCPWWGKPVQADSLTGCDGAVVGFCNPGCRDRFASAVRHFEAARAESALR